jgi:hypothetical protein
MKFIRKHKTKNIKGVLIIMKKKYVISMSILLLLLIVVSYFKSNETNFELSSEEVRKNIEIEVQTVLNEIEDTFVLVFEVKNNNDTDIKNFNVYLAFPIISEGSNISAFSSTSSPILKCSKKPNVSVLEKNQKIICSVALTKDNLPDNYDFENPVINITGFYNEKTLDYFIDKDDIVKN